MKYQCFWKNPSYKPFAKLKKDIECEYLIVGGGISGVSLAYFLNKLGFGNIVVIEKYTIAHGATGNAAGMFVPEMESTNLEKFMKMYGKEKTMLYWQSQVATMHLAKQIMEEERIECEFEEQPYMILGKRKNDIEEIMKEYKIRKSLHTRVKLMTGRELEKEIQTPFFHTGEYLRHGISLNPMKFTQNLAHVAAKKGVHIYEKTPLLRQKGSKAITPDATISFKKIFYVTDGFLPEKKIHRYKTTIAVSEKLNKEQLQYIDCIKKEMFIDSEIPSFHYGKITKDQRFLVGYGDVEIDHKNLYEKLHRPHLRNIERFFKKIYPRLKLKFTYAWTGMFGLSKSYLPVFRFGKQKIVFGGAGTQVISLMMARYVANRLANKKQLLDTFFRRIKSD